MRNTTRSVSAIACVLFVSACAADQSVTPLGIASREVAMGAIGGLRADRKDTLAAAGVFRLVPLTQNLAVTKVIGAEGGTISIPAAGLLITVPAGALTAETEISITARTGMLVAYDMKPTGLKFAKKLIFSQQLRGTNAPLTNGSSFQLVSYDDMRALTSRGANVTGLTEGSVDADVFTAAISRSSGYIMSCGRRDASAEEEM